MNNQSIATAPLMTAADAHATEVARGERFEFGSNWARFLEVLDEERILSAERALQDMLQLQRLDGLRFLDIGSGSGLSSLAARRLGLGVAPDVAVGAGAGDEQPLAELHRFELIQSHVDRAARRPGVRGGFIDRHQRRDDAGVGLRFCVGHAALHSMKMAGN